MVSTPPQVVKPSTTVAKPLCEAIESVEVPLPIVVKPVDEPSVPSMNLNRNLGPVLRAEELEDNYKRRASHVPVLPKMNNFQEEQEEPSNLWNLDFQAEHLENTPVNHRVNFGQQRVATFVTPNAVQTTTTVNNNNTVATNSNCCNWSRKNQITC